MAKDSFNCLKDIEEAALDLLSKREGVDDSKATAANPITGEDAAGISGPFVLGYYKGGADQMQTLRDNGEAFNRYRLLPRVLVDVSSVKLGTNILDNKHSISIPIGICPTAMHTLAHKDGELASARAAQEKGTVFIMSSASHYSMEEVAEAAPRGIKWMQMIIYKDKELMLHLVRRAEKSGFSAVVLSVDLPCKGFRYETPLSSPAMWSRLRLGNFETEEARGQCFICQPGVTWEDVAWLRTQTKMPIVLKGILRADDALRAISVGASAIIISNHGGRQLDTVPATIDVLRSIKRAVGNSKLDIFLDGGIRTGTDVLKALALGAKMVFVGRPVLWGLAWKGQSGVEITLDLLREELKRAMMLTGVTSVEDVPEDIVVVPGSCI